MQKQRQPATLAARSQAPQHPRELYASHEMRSVKKRLTSTCPDSARAGNRPGLGPKDVQGGPGSFQILQPKTSCDLDWGLEACKVSEARPVSVQASRPQIQERTFAETRLCYPLSMPSTNLPTAFDTAAMSYFPKQAYLNEFWQGVLLHV